MSPAVALLLVVLGAGTAFNTSAPASGSSYLFKENGTAKATIEAGGFYCPGAAATASLPGTCKNGSIVWDSTASKIKYCASNAWIVAGSGSAAATADALSTDPTACAAGQYVSDVAASGALTCSMPNQLYDPYTNHWDTPAEVGATRGLTYSGLKNQGDLDDGYWNHVINIAYPTDATTQLQLSLTPARNLWIRSAARTSGSWSGWERFARIAEVPEHDVLASDFTTTSATGSTITGFQRAYVSGTKRRFECHLVASGTATGFPRVRVSSGAATTIAYQVVYDMAANPTTTMGYLGANSSNQLTASCTSTCDTGKHNFHVTGQILGSTIDFVAIQAANSTAGQTTTVYEGSSCTWYD